MSIIEFKAGTFEGNVIVDQVGSVRRGEVKIRLRVTETGNSSTLLPNVNKICQAELVIEGMDIKVQGEMGHVGTYKNGDAAIDLVIENDVWAQKLFAKVKDSGSVVINFSSTKAKADKPDAGNLNLDGLEEGA